MKYIRQFVIILFISFIGEALKYVLPLPIPASIYGLVLMFVLLETKVMKVEAVQDAGKFLIEIMPMMFIPAGVGPVSYTHLALWICGPHETPHAGCFKSGEHAAGQIADR